MGNFWRDFLYAARVLRQAPGFTSIAIAVLAIGIGANGAIFTLVDAVLVRPLPFAQANELVELWEKPPGHDRNAVSPLNYLDWSEQNQVFASMTGVSGSSRTMITDGIPERVHGQAVTVRFFDVFGVAPAAGRTFAADDGKPGTRAIVISDALWRSRFGANTNLVGSTIVLDAEPWTVIGVMPATFEVWQQADYWMLFPIERRPEMRLPHYLRVFARLKPGIGIAQARAAMNVIGENLARAYPATNKGWGVTMLPLREATVGETLRTTSLVLAGVVALVLLMACANVANLLLARGAGRSREIAVRAALGGSAGRIFSQLLTESALLALVGGALGIALAWAAVAAAPKFLPAGTLPPGVRLALDGRVAAFSAVLTVVTGLLAGLAPAWHAARTSLTDALRAGGRTAAEGMGAFRSALAAAEIAVAVTLAAGAGLLLRTLVSLDRVETGIQADHVLTAQLSLSGVRYRKPASTLPLYEAVEREVAALPGVRSAALSTTLPSQGWDIGMPAELVDRPVADPSKRKAVHYQMVSPRYFATLGIPVLAGRAFTEHDNQASSPVCIVNEEFVHEYMEGREPLGVRVRVDSMGDVGPVPVVREIVGVIRQVEVDGPEELRKSPEAYVPLAQNPWFWSVLSLRTAGEPAAMTRAIKEAIARVDRNQAVGRIATMEELLSETVAQPRFRAELVGAFAALAMVLSAVGVFGVFAFSVSRRMREFGIRSALGAKAGDLLRMVLAAGLRIIAVGLAIGLAGAAALTRSLGSLLFGVKPVDPATFLFASGILGLVALLACAVPAIRAARVDPSVALRQE
ncbi:MAG TPA: ABC transporter permease [Candidatus Acidoferrales bacterium]|nr:ABC transporter permease [Candidatus Acidoferrales bacterium]